MNEEQKSKGVEIIVNSRPFTWDNKEISYEQVIQLAFGTYETNDQIEYTVAWILKNDNQSGTLVKGSTLKVKKDMRFNVKRTDRS